MLIPRLAKIVCVASVALYMALVAFGNVTDYWTNYPFVVHVLSMDQVFPESTIRWRAITSPALHHAAYILIILTEIAAAALSAAGTIAMCLRIRGDGEDFRSAKGLAIAGLALGFLLFEGGFVAIGGEWFGMWQSKSWNGVEGSFRVAMILLGVLIFVSLRDDERC
jgi:predicted small integral membrane protein